MLIANRKPLAKPVIYTRPPLYTKQEDAIFSGKRITCVEASTKSGKEITLDSLLYTPRGPITMRDVKVGQTLLSISGTTTVLGVYPQGNKPCYRVTFSDNTYVDCGANHLWEVHSNDHTKPDKIARYVRTTRSLRGIKELNRYWVPAIEPFAYKKKNVFCDPYTLGLYIAEGSSSSSAVISGLLVSLRYYGLFNIKADKKFIPKQYIYNDVETRLNILRGIMDGDGFVDKRGQAHIEITSKQLAYDIKEIIESLGGYCRINCRAISGYKKDGIFIQCKPIWRVNIVYEDASNLFTLNRKVAACKPRMKYIRRTLKSIEYIGMREMQCIMVDHPSHLYLTNGGIPTHNTHGALAWIFENTIIGKRNRNHWWIAPVYSQSAIAFNRLLTALEGTRLYYHVDRSDLVISLSGERKLFFKSGEKPDNLYGEDVDSAVIDEASRLRAESFHAVRSTLTATRGPLVAIGNVRGRKNWFYKLCRQVERGQIKNAHYAKITAMDAVNSGVLDAEEIEEARALLPDSVFRELYLAEASEDGSNPFGIQNIYNCLISDLSPLPVVCYGIDLAKSTDYTVIIGLDEYGQVCHFERFQKQWTTTVKDIVALPNVPMMIDSTGVGDAPVEFVQKRRTPETVWGFKFNAHTKQPLIEELALTIATQDIWYPDGIIKSELEDYEYVYTRTGVLFSAPEGFHDDAVIALALANRMRKQLNNAPGLFIGTLY